MAKSSLPIDIDYMTVNFQFFHDFHDFSTANTGSQYIGIKHGFPIFRITCVLKNFKTITFAIGFFILKSTKTFIGREINCNFWGVCRFFFKKITNKFPILIQYCHFFEELWLVSYPPPP